MKKLLTIAIPTYNRAAFLDRCLAAIHLQMDDYTSMVEILVLDNCSEDNTEEVVGNYIRKGMPLQYVRHATNRGADYNIAQCYLLAQTEYAVAFGDDDIFANGAISAIVKVLQKHSDIGLVHVNSLGFHNADLISNERISEIAYDVYEESEDFLRKVNHKVTFISANIVNTSFYKDLDVSDFIGSNLVQLPFVMRAIIDGKRNIFINSNLIHVQVGNTGGYSITRVFGKNFNGVSSLIINEGYDQKYFQIIRNAILTMCMPHWVYLLKAEEHDFVDSDMKTDLKEVYAYHPFFWIMVYPLIVSKKIFLPVLWPIIRIAAKVYRTIHQVLFTIAKKSFDMRSYTMAN